MAHRRGAHERGAWVREAADAYAAKQAARAARPRRCGCGVSSRGWPLWEVFVRSRRGLSHAHVGSLHAPDAEMALRNARDVFTRREEGVSIWVVPAGAITRQQPGREGRVLRPGRRQGLPPPDLLRRARRGRAPVSARPTAPGRRPYALRLGDDALVLAQRMGEWIASAPELEEDVALANIGLDLLGQARALLTYAGAADGRSEDDLAYLRDAGGVPQRAAGRAARRR